MRENLPIEVKFSRWVVEDADPYVSKINWAQKTAPSGDGAVGYERLCLAM
jgi:hypothetical protein